MSTEQKNSLDDEGLSNDKDMPNQIHFDRTRDVTVLDSLNAVDSTPKNITDKGTTDNKSEINSENQRLVSQSLVDGLIPNGNESVEITSK